MTEPSNVAASHRLLDPTQVAVLAVTGSHGDPGAGSLDWPCPGCGQRRRLSQARTAIIRNRAGAQMRRTVYLCDACLADGFKPATT